MSDRQRVCGLAELKEGRPYPVTVDDDEFVIILSGGNVYAMYDRCSHQDFPLSLGSVGNGRIKCAAHGAEFDLATGKAMCAPAFAPVSVYPVTVEGDDVFIEID